MPLPLPAMAAIDTMLTRTATLTLSRMVSLVFGDPQGVGIQLVAEPHQGVIQGAAEQYLYNYANRHGLLKVLGMRDPVALESVYTTVQFLEQAERHWYESITSLEQAYRSAGQRSFQPKESNRLDGLNVANEKQFLMVLGGPGSGKSTFIRKIGLEALKGSEGGYQHRCIPVVLELKNCDSKQFDLVAAIVHEFQICGFPQADVLARRLLERGELLILLDGLDEVPSRYAAGAIQAIQDFVDRYQQNRFIASCRLAAYRSRFRRFSDVAMAEFSPGQIKQFIENWFSSPSDRQVHTAQKCWDLLHKPEYVSAKELAQTPLLLTLLCLVYDRSQNFPTNRSSLYRKALRVLLEEWASEKRIMREEIYQGMNTDLEELLLGEIAYSGFVEDRLFFEKRELVSQIKAFLADNLNAPKHLDGEAVLNAIAIQQGILVERAEEIFSFSHLTLQEYLTAQYLTDHHQTALLPQQHLVSKRWQEVFLLVSGLMRAGVDQLLLEMNEQAKQYIQTPKLQALLQWADAVTSETTSSLRPVAKRATVLFLAVSCDRALEFIHLFDPELARALDLLRNLALLRTPVPPSDRMPQDQPVSLPTPSRELLLNSRSAKTMAQAVTRALAKAFERNKILEHIDLKKLIHHLEDLKGKTLGQGLSQAAIRVYQERLGKTWCNVLRLDPVLLHLSSDELKALDHYLYSSWLIVRCQRSAMRLSPATWEAIEAEILRIPTL